MRTLSERQYELRVFHADGEARNVVLRANGSWFDCLEVADGVPWPATGHLYATMTAPGWRSVVPMYNQIEAKKC